MLRKLVLGAVLCLLLSKISLAQLETSEHSPEEQTASKCQQHLEKINEVGTDLRDGAIAAVITPFVLVWLVGSFLIWVLSWGIIDVDLVYPVILIVAGLQSFADIPGLVYQIAKELVGIFGDCLFNPKLIYYHGNDL